MNCRSHCGPTLKRLAPFARTNLSLRSGSIETGLRGRAHGLHEVLEELLDVLIIDVQQFFKSVQLGILEDLPPFAANHRVRRLRYLPAVRFLKLRGRFLVNRGRRSNRRMILGADRATHQCEEEGSRQEGGGYVLTNDLKENNRSYLVRPVSKRNQMRRSVSSIQFSNRLVVATSFS